MWKRVVPLYLHRCSSKSISCNLGIPFLGNRQAFCSEILSSEKNDAVVSSKNPVFVFVLGGPGSGKGTQCAKIAETYGFTHMSAGALLRDLILSNSDEGSMIRRTIIEGKIVPSEVTVQLIKKEMESSQTNKFLIDGFPRCEENRLAFEKMVRLEPEMVLYFHCSEDQMIERVLSRNEGRDDDNIDTIKKRLEVFRSMTLPVINYYSNIGKLHKIDALGSVDKIFADVRLLFAKYAQVEEQHAAWST